MKLFAHWMNGAPRNAWHSLLDIASKRVNLFWYEHESRTVLRDANLPWPLVFIVACFNRKFVWCNGGIAQVDRIREQVSSFENRVRWSCALDGADALRPWLRLKREAAPPYRGPRNFELEHMLRVTRDEMFDDFRRCRSTCLPRRRSNFYPLVRYAWRLAESLDVRVVPNDKEPGFTMMHRKDFVAVIEEFLGGRWYREIAQPSEDRRDGQRRGNFQLCKCVAAFEECPSLVFAVAKSKRNGSSSSAVLKLLIKSHKAAGLVSFRNVHTCPRWSYECLARWLDKTIMARLAEVAPHLLASREDLVERLQNLTWRPGSRMVPPDMKEFFMSGDSSQLAEAVGKLFAGLFEKNLVTDISFWLLATQRVSCRELPHRAWEVMEGSGRGLTHSSFCC